MTLTETAVNATCPICDSVRFKPYGVREKAMCVQCNSVERTRYLWLHLTRGKPLSVTDKVLHVAPEKCLSGRLLDKLGANYRPVDFQPSRYVTDSVRVEHIDLTDISHIPDNEFGVVMHLHVLEHLLAPLDGIFRETMRVIRPGGRFIFALPISSGITIENIWPDATPAERLERFGQHDHVRLVGRLDFPRFLTRVLTPFSDQKDFRVNPSDFISEAHFVRFTGLNFHQVMPFTGNTLFEVIKRLPQSP